MDQSVTMFAPSIPRGFNEFNPHGQRIDDELVSTSRITEIYRGTKTVEGAEVRGVFIRVELSSGWMRIASPTYDELVTMLTCRVLPRSENPNWIAVPPPQPSPE